MTTTDPLSAQPEFRDEAGIERHARAFLACELPKDAWTHAGHLAATLWLLRFERDGLEDRLPGLIRAYNASVGGVNSDTEGYHETITQASLQVTEAELLRHGAGVPLATVLTAVLDGPLGQSGWILAYWSRERLFSVEARRAWVEPDLAPLPR